MEYNIPIENEKKILANVSIDEENFIMDVEDSIKKELKAITPFNYTGR